MSGSATGDGALAAAAPGGTAALGRPVALRGDAVRVELPEGLLAETAGAFLARWRGLDGAIHPGPAAGGRALGPGVWALSVGRRAARWVDQVLRDPQGRLSAAWVHRGRIFVRQPAGALVVSAPHVPVVLQALESVRPEQLDDRGLPLPWVPPAAPTRAMGAGRGLEDDVEVVASAPVLPTAPAGPRPVLDPRDDASVVGAVHWTAGRAGFGALPVELLRPGGVRDGFVAGRVWLAPRGPVRMRLELGPNADAAEVWATLLHELAHGLGGGGRHDAAFRRALVELAESVVPEGVFTPCRDRVDGPTPALDAWLALCLRAALRGGPVPAPETGDEGQLARVVARIQKLRRLARSAPGSPEAVSATAVANELLVRWDLGAYQVRLEAGIDEAMCDRWVDIGQRVVWRRTLGFLVAEHCGVFALARKARGWMHFFGRHADVVTAEWFFEIWTAHIERAADDHIAAFKARRAAGRATGNVRSERTDFCDSAVYGLRQKLQKVDAASEGADRRERQQRLAAARACAAEEHGRRGGGWSAGTGKAVRLHAEGVAAGRAAPMGRGVGRGRGPRGLLDG